MYIIENALSDRGSKYAVSGGPVADSADAKAFIKELCRKKKFARATHNTWAVILPDGTPLKNDDGESGAGMVILRMLERADRIGEIVVVTRWFGGLGPCLASTHFNPVSRAAPSPVVARLYAASSSSAACMFQSAAYRASRASKSS